VAGTFALKGAKGGETKRRIGARAAFQAAASAALAVTHEPLQPNAAPRAHRFIFDIARHLWTSSGVCVMVDSPLGGDMTNETAGSHDTVADALEAVGGTEGVRAALDDAASDPMVAESLDSVGGAAFVSEALAAASEAMSAHAPLDADVAAAVRAAGGGSAIAAALTSAGAESIAGEALEAVGGEAALTALFDGAVLDENA